MEKSNQYKEGSTLYFDTYIKTKTLHTRKAHTVHHRDLPKRSLKSRLRGLKLMTLGKTARVSIIIVVGLLVGLSGMFLATSYKVKSYKLNNLKYIDNKSLGNDINTFLVDKTFFKLSVDDLASYLKNRYPLIKNIHINKSLLHGIIIDIDEFYPKAIVELNDSKKYLFTSSSSLVDFNDKISVELYTLRFTGSKEDLMIVSNYVNKCIQFVSGMKAFGITGEYAFDNFGNLSILTLDGKSIQADMREKYRNIDEQLKVLQNTLALGNFSKINLRFNNLIVEK